MKDRDDLDVRRDSREVTDDIRENGDINGNGTANGVRRKGEFLGNRMVV